MKVKNIDTETDEGLLKYHSLMQPDSPLFQELEKRFNDHLENSNPASELKDKYFSEDAIYTAKGAIQGAIEMIFEVMQEEDLKEININSELLDYEAIWQD